MSDTPRTDAQLTEFDSISKYGKHFKNRRGTVSAEFARGLERELAEVRALLREELERPSRDVECKALRIERDELRKDLEMAKGSIRILRAETATICVGRTIIGILAREGCWKSESGTALIAADDLFRRDPCEELAWVCNLLGRANQYLQAQESSEALQFKKEIEDALAKRRAVHGLGGNPPPGNTAGREEGA
jgi:hypothetical protein